MERILDRAMLALQDPRSIFFFFVAFAFTVLIVLETPPLLKLGREVIRERSLYQVLSKNRRAPLGWLLVAVMACFALTKVKW